MVINGLVKWLIGIGIVLIACSASTFAADPAVAAGESRDTRDHRYLGTLRLYVVEPTSRYQDYYSVPYGFGFLGFAVNQPITLTYSDTLSDAITWTGSGLVESNIMVIGVVLNGKDNQGWSDPSGPDCPFVAHYVDATAAATPGQPGLDTASGAYTHTVFVEEVTSPG